MNIFRVFSERVETVVRHLIAQHYHGVEADFSRALVEPPRDSGHGDLSSNAAMVLAKPLGVNPREFATRIATELAADPDVETAEVAGPGFVNLRLRPAYWQKLVGQIVTSGDDYGRTTLGGGVRINVEYVSANPTGPMHVGHCRGAVFGDALSNLLAAAGFDVTREYYINDAGAQVDVLARSAFLRYREALGEAIGPIPEGLYPGDYLKPVGEALAREYGNALLELDEAAWLPIVRDAAIAAMMALIRGDLEALNVHHDVFFSERTLTAGNGARIEAAIDALRDKGLIYQGRLPPPKGQLPDDWEDREQILFRSTEFGDDTDRALKKSDGSYTYFAADIAYHYDKYRRGFTQMIDVLGADHGGYVKRIEASVRALSGGQVTLDARICQLVKLTRNGEPVKMSKRSGEFITLRDVVDEVGADAVRFMMVFRKNDAPLDFDFQKVTEQSKDNPVFYVQYAHARTCSIFRQAEAEVPGLPRDAGSLATAPLDLLGDEAELGLIRRLAEYPRIVEAAAQSHEPHRIAFYLYELAADFHALWNRGKEMPQLRFINPTERDLTSARLALVHATNLVLSSGLSILGVNAPEEMR